MAMTKEQIIRLRDESIKEIALASELRLYSWVLSYEKRLEHLDELLRRRS